MAGAKSPHPTLYEVLTSVRRNQDWRSTAVEGLKPQPFAKREGTAMLQPEQLLSIRVPVQRITDGDVRGYQRHLNASKARAIARFLTATENYDRRLPVIEVSVDGHGNAFYTDGQHRAAGAVIARKPIRVLVTRRSEQEARQLFASQGKATRPNRNVLIFDGDGPFEEYIQDAVTDPRHPWNALISSGQSSATKTRMSATAAMGMLQTYVGKSNPGGGSRVPSDIQESRFEETVAHDLAVLMGCFGTRMTNPLAYSSVSLRAIAMVARAVFRDRVPHPDDRDRWIRHMPRFTFGQYAYLRTAPDMAEKLLAHWNKKLPAERRASL